MIRKLLLALVGLAVVIGGIVYVKLGQFGAMAEAGAKMVPPPETVTATVAEPAHWEQTLTATGTLSAVQGVTVSAEAPGRLRNIQFESGARVQAGDVLLQMDTAGEAAQLASAEAGAELARATLERRRELAKRQLVSPADVDAAAAQAKEAAARVGVARALLAKKTVRAPFTGRLGLRQVNLGQILREGDPIVSLQSLDPINADFPIAQQQLARLGTGMPVRLTTDAAPGRIFEGRITAISPEVDPTTRNLRVQAQVGNDREALRAGMFVNVSVVLPQPAPVLPVPATAIVYAPFGDSVFVVENAPSGGATPPVLRQRFVRLGQARGDFVDVTDGLKPGETVVTSGVFKLRSGMAVVVDNTLAPTPRLEPKFAPR